MGHTILLRFQAAGDVGRMSWQQYFSKASASFPVDCQFGACLVCETGLSVQHLQKVKFNILNTNAGCETGNNDAQRTVLTQKTES